MGKRWNDPRNFNSKGKRPYKIQQVVNWFFGNYCTRKCYEKNEKAYQHWLKLQELAKRLEGVEMTHNEFLTMTSSPH